MLAYPKEGRLASVCIAKTAKVLGAKIPDSVLLRTDRVIE
jgi:hypothetical protein